MFKKIAGYCQFDVFSVSFGVNAGEVFLDLKVRNVQMVYCGDVFADAMVERKKGKEND